MVVVDFNACTRNPNTGTEEKKILSVISTGFELVPILEHYFCRNMELMAEVDGLDVIILWTLLNFASKNALASLAGVCSKSFCHCLYNAYSKPEYALPELTD